MRELEVNLLRTLGLLEKGLLERVGALYAGYGPEV